MGIDLQPGEGTRLDHVFDAAMHFARFGNVNGVGLEMIDLIFDPPVDGAVLDKMNLEVDLIVGWQFFAGVDLA